MQTKPIYLDNLELALQMRETGFDRECAHNASIVKHITGNATINVLAYDVVVAKLGNSKNIVFKDLSLPTLGEIELPHHFIVLQNEKGFFQIWRKKIMHAYNSYTHFELYPIYDVDNLAHKEFETELEARCHAWLWANKREVQDV